MHCISQETKLQTGVLTCPRLHNSAVEPEFPPRSDWTLNPMFDLSTPTSKYLRPISWEFYPTGTSQFQNLYCSAISPLYFITQHFLSHRYQICIKYSHRCSRSDLRNIQQEGRNPLPRVLLFKSCSLKEHARRRTTPGGQEGKLANRASGKLGPNPITLPPPLGDCPCAH